MQHIPSERVFKINTLLSASGLCHPAPSQLMESYLAPFWQSGTRTQTQKMSLSLLQCWSVVYRLPQTQQQLFEGGRVLGRVNPFLFTPVRPTHCCLHTARFPKATGVVDWFSLNPIFKDWTFSLFVLIQSWRQFIEICSKLIVAICCLSHVCQSPFRLSAPIYSLSLPIRSLFCLLPSVFAIWHNVLYACWHVWWSWAECWQVV